MTSHLAGTPLCSHPAVRTPSQAAALMNLSKHALQHIGLQPIPVLTRETGVRQHVRCRLADVVATTTRPKA